MNQIELPPECWLLIIEKIDYYQTMINLSRVSKLLYSLIPDESWLIKVDNNSFNSSNRRTHYSYLLGTNIKHGKLKSYLDNKKIISNRFINGKLEGTSKYWYPNGNLSGEKNMDQLKDGLKMEY